jgi:hypothetical protein
VYCFQSYPNCLVNIADATKTNDYTFLTVEFDSKSTRITFSISRTLFSADSRETSEHWCPLSNPIKHLGLAILFHGISGDFKGAICTGSLGMDNSLGNAFTVEMRNLVNKLKVLQETRNRSVGLRIQLFIHGTTRTNSQTIGIINHWISVGCR